MKNRYSINIVVLLMICILCCNVCTSCSKKSAKPEESSQSKKKPPGALSEMESSVLDIIKALDVKEEEEKQESKVKIESKTEIKMEEDPKKAANEAKMQTTEEIKKDTPDEEKWKEVKKTVEDIHKQFNSMQPDLVKAGTPTSIIDKLSKTLNELTLYVEAKDKQNTLFVANELYNIIPDILEKFDSKIPSDVKRIGYYIRDTKYNAMVNKWDKSLESITNAKSHWDIVKVQLKKEQEDQGGKLEFALQELEKVVKESNIMLTKLKSDLALEDLKKLEESFEK